MTDSAISLRDIHSFHVGGCMVELTGQPRQTVQVSPDAAARTVDMNGLYVSGQLYAQHFELQHPISDIPVMFWHDGAMTGVTWETTPDGRPSCFCAGVTTSSYPMPSNGDVRPGCPIPRSTTAHHFSAPPRMLGTCSAWAPLRASRATRRHAGPSWISGFPWTGSTSSVLNSCLAGRPMPRHWSAYGDLVSRFERVLIVAHSQGGWFAQHVAAQISERIAAVVVVEPAGAPNLGNDQITACSKVPHLYVWGDNCNEHPAWKAYKTDAIAHYKRLHANGDVVEHLDLPRRGILGNSHMPMMDDNSDELSELVMGWPNSTIGHTVVSSDNEQVDTLLCRKVLHRPASEVCGLIHSTRLAPI